MQAFALIVCYIRNLSQMKAIRFQTQSITPWELSHLHCNQTCLNYWGISIYILIIDSQKMLPSSVEGICLKLLHIMWRHSRSYLFSKVVSLVWQDANHNASNKWRLQMEVDARTAQNCHQHRLFISWSPVTEWIVCHVWYWWRTIVYNKNSKEQPVNVDGEITIGNTSSLRLQTRA